MRRPEQAAAAEKKAKDVAARAKRGEKFAELARENSDDIETGKNGGYIGSIQTITSRSLGSESYLVKLCPFFVTAAANPAVNHGFTPITFTANPSGGTPAYTFNWEFGDNDSGQGQVVQHIYRTPGTYVATLTARDAAGATVIIADAHSAPVEGRRGYGVFRM